MPRVTVTLLDEHGEPVVCIVRGCSNVPAEPANGILCEACMADVDAAFERKRGRPCRSLAAMKAQRHLEALTEESAPVTESAFGPIER